MAYLNVYFCCYTEVTVEEIKTRKYCMQNFSALNMKEHEMRFKLIAFHELYPGSGHHLAHDTSSNPVV